MSIAGRLVLLVLGFWQYRIIRTQDTTSFGPCDFQNDFCVFTNDGGNNVNWARSSDNVDVRFLSLSYARPSSDKTSRITSSTITKSNVNKCLEFYFSTNVTSGTAGVLKVFRKTIDGTSNEQLMWSTGSSSGNEWRRILVELYNVTNDVQVIFEGKLSRDSDVWIKIDDVSILSGSCFTRYVCDFEDSFCMAQDDGDTTDWRRFSGRTYSYSTGPSTDHTLGTNLGHYAYLEASTSRYYYYYASSSYYYNYNPQVVARMKTPTQRSSSNVRDTCLVFWYHMYGYDIATLSVFISRDGESSESVIFNKTGDGGNVWKTAHVPITEPNNFKIIFQAVKGNGVRGDIAVDDILISHEKCVIGFQCDFDHGSCVEQDDTDNKDWTIGRSWTSYDGIYLLDHTSATWRGKYAYLSATNFRQDDIATISTPLLAAETTDKFCLRFWYRSFGEDIGELSVSQSNSDGTLGSILWQQHAKHQVTNIWREGEVTFVPYDNYKIVFRAKGGAGTEGFLSLDDIKIDNLPCVNLEEFNCTFEEEEFCLQNGSSKNYEWRRHSRFDYYNAGPFFDHTIGDDKGHYAFVNAHGGNDVNDTAIMVTPILHNTAENDTKCLIFWYHMYGIHIESLEVFILKMQAELPGELVWIRSGNRGNIWRAAEVELSEKDSFQVVFRSIRGNGIDGDIGVDDIKIRNGSCLNTGVKAVINVSCQFEETHLCGYTQASNTDYNWTWTNSALGTKHEAPGIPTIDHTTSTGLGFYIFADFRLSKLIKDVYRLQSPITDDTSIQCLEFWHYIYGTNSQELRVLLKQTNSEAKLIKSIKGSRGSYWQRSAKQISPTDKYQIIFEALSGVTPNGGITIDDVNVTRGNCVTVPTPAYTLTTVKEIGCGFEDKDLCGFTQATDDDFDWAFRTAANMAKFYETRWWYNWYGPGHDWYPRSDRSYPDSDKGTFLYNQVDFFWWRYWRRRRNNEEYAEYPAARLLSPLIEQTETETCLKFWLYKQSTESDYLSVYMLPYSQVFNGDPLVAYYGGYGNRWLLQQVTLPPSSEHFQIIFEVKSGELHYTSSFIDEIDYIRSPCKNEDIVCDFQGGLNPCPIVSHLSSDGFQWQLSRAYTATEGTGPRADHTFGNDTGIYVYMDASQPQKAGDKATISTNYWKNIEEASCLTFWYYCNSSFSGSLVVHKHARLEQTFVWEMPEIFESRWTEVRLQIPPANASYQIVFTGEVGNSVLGDIALDDIVLSRTSCVEPISNLPPIDGASDSSTPALKSYDCGMNKERSKCNIAQLSSDQFDWSYSENDSSYKCSSENKYIGQKAQFKTPRFFGENKQCLEVIYKTTGVAVPNFSVFKVESTSKMTLLWSSDTIANDWITKQIKVPSSSSSYNMIFEATVTESGNGTVHIQTIRMSSGKCRNLSSSQVLVTVIVIIIVMAVLVAMSLAGYRWRKTLASFHLNVRHKTLSEDVSISNVHNDKSPIVDDA